jgi:hypothetical protein
MIQENIVTNVCLWDGNPETWQPPQNAIMLVEATTPTKIWELVNKEYVLVDSIGGAGVGFTYDGTYCITNESKPEVSQPAGDQPNSSGTVTI